ncbi:MAG: lactate dehydrogenase [Bacillota bacterium]|jgi:hypothetical protein|nr:lactate dehydrogenase [Bacillota bacterium]NLM07348.1 lactate dehydrogenase [Clostridiales Family XIII bacterium]
MNYLSELMGFSREEISGKMDPIKVDESIKLKGVTFSKDRKLTVNILALGDVGGVLLTGLRVLGGSVVGEIGIYDLNPDVMMRYEQEMNQIAWPFDYAAMPSVRILKEEELFQGDVFLFCASKAVPPVAKVEDVRKSQGAGPEQDVRMVQFEANRPLVEHYAKMASRQGFKGLFGVISDPVDPLCKSALMASGLEPWQIRGYGLGVMNSRAVYYAKKDGRFARFLTEGRVFGPHGKDLVVADSVENYDHELSVELTRLTIEANLRVRELGFKPYIAPAFSSGVLSMLCTLRGEWHYSSFYIGDNNKGAFLGAKNRLVDGVTEVENLPLPPQLFDRIRCAYENLCGL